MRKNKKVLTWIIIIALVIGGGFWYFQSREKGPEYITEIVKRIDVKQTISVTGELVPKDKADLAFEVSGQVVSVDISVGDRVEEGQTLVKLDSGVLLKQFIQAQENRNIAQENLDLDRRDWDALKPEEKEVKKATLRSAQAAMEAAGYQLAKSTLRSPLDGVVTKVNIKAGEVATLNVPVITVMKENGFEIEADIPESDIAQIKIGQKAEVVFDAFTADDIFEAEVMEIEPAATVIQDVVYYRVKFNLVNPASLNRKTLKFGFSADVDVLIAEKENVLAVSSRSVKDEDGKKYIEILKSDGTTEKIFMETGLRGDGGMIEITSGLVGGEEIITFVKEK